MTCTSPATCSPSCPSRTGTWSPRCSARSSPSPTPHPRPHQPTSQSDESCHLAGMIRCEIPAKSAGSTPVFDIARWLDDLASGGKYSRRSVVIFRMVLRAALADAVESGDLRHSPAARVGMPMKVVKPGHQREAEAWTDDEVQAFLAAIAGHRWAAPIRLSVFDGLRRSELLGLRWSAVDLRKRTVRIERALIEVHGRPEWSEGKNA